MKRHRVALLVTAALVGACTTDPAAEHSATSDIAPTIATASPTGSTAAPATSPPATALPPTTQWALDYVNGSTRLPAGEPFRIGFASGSTGDITAAQAAGDFVNESLGGVSGRPLQLEICDASSAPTLEEQSMLALPCGERLAADPDIHMVLIGDLFTLDTSFTDAIAATKPVYLNYGYQSGGLSYNPNGVETLAAAALFIEEELAADFDRLFAIDPVAVSPLIKGVLPDLPIIDLPFDQFTTTTTDQAVDLVAGAGITSDDLVFLQMPECSQIVEAFDRLGIAPHVVSGGGCSLVARDGWYQVNLGWNPDHPSLDTGALVAATELERRGADTAWIRTFADIVTLTAIINRVGADAAMPDVLERELREFHGVPVLGAGPVDCESTMVIGFPLGNCATVVDVYQLRGGEWSALRPIATG